VRNVTRKLVFSYLITVIGFGGGLVAAPPGDPTRVLQDPKSKVVYYLESDQRHIAAVSPDGKLLWCRAVANGKTGDRIVSFSFWKPGNWPPRTMKREDCIAVIIGGSGNTEVGNVNKITGTFEPGDVL